MASFHPASGRIVRPREDDGAPPADRPDDGNGNNDTHPTEEEDELQSDFSSDLDDPYHETASEWHRRSVRRRARRLAGISSDSSSSSSSECSSDEGEAESEGNDDDDDRDGGERGTRRKAMAKAVRSAHKPLARWLAAYPLVAARCCLAAIPSEDNGNNPHRNMGPPLSTRAQESKRLRRIIRRLRRKQEEYRAKFGENGGHAAPSTQRRANGSYYDSANALSLAQTTAINEDCQETEKDRKSVESFLPQGTKISFLGAVLAREAPLPSNSSASQNEPQTLSRLVLELAGPARSGMTSILLAVAARYVACTSNALLGINGAPETNEARSASECSPRPTKRRRQDFSTAAGVTEPRVVILDLEKGVHAAKLISSVKEAVLRRWAETEPARQWKTDQEQLWKHDGSETETNEASDIGARDESSNAMYDKYEQRQIELAIASCLGRIHVVQPRDFTYLSLVATMELLKHSLDKEKALRNPTAEAKKRPSPPFGHPKMNRTQSSNNNPVNAQEAPTLILIDSLTTLDASTRFQESLPATAGSNRSSGSSGLSDRNVFYRQLIRLREEHEVAIIGASRSAPSASRPNDPSTRRSMGGPSGSSGLWDKMVSHRVSLHHVAEGTAEDQAGYEFVATMNASGNQDGATVFPYSITAGGIVC